MEGANQLTSVRSLFRKSFHSNGQRMVAILLILLCLISRVLATDEDSANKEAGYEGDDDEEVDPAHSAPFTRHSQVHTPSPLPSSDYSTENERIISEDESYHYPSMQRRKEEEESTTKPGRTPPLSNHRNGRTMRRDERITKGNPSQSNIGGSGSVSTRMRSHNGGSGGGSRPSFSSSFSNHPKKGGSNGDNSHHPHPPSSSPIPPSIPSSTKNQSRRIPPTKKHNGQRREKLAELIAKCSISLVILVFSLSILFSDLRNNRNHSDTGTNSSSNNGNCNTTMMNQCSSNVMNSNTNEESESRKCCVISRDWLHRGPLMIVADLLMIILSLFDSGLLLMQCLQWSFHSHSQRVEKALRVSNVIGMALITIISLLMCSLLFDYFSQVLRQIERSVYYQFDSTVSADPSEVNEIVQTPAITTAHHRCCNANEGDRDRGEGYHSDCCRSGWAGGNGSMKTASAMDAECETSGESTRMVRSTWMKTDLCRNACWVSALILAGSWVLPLLFTDSMWLISLLSISVVVLLVFLVLFHVFSYEMFDSPLFFHSEDSAYGALISLVDAHLISVVIAVILLICETKVSSNGWSSSSSMIYSNNDNDNDDDQSQQPHRNGNHHINAGGIKVSMTVNWYWIAFLSLSFWRGLFLIGYHLWYHSLKQCGMSTHHSNHNHNSTSSVSIDEDMMSVVTAQHSHAHAHIHPHIHPHQNGGGSMSIELCDLSMRNMVLNDHLDHHHHHHSSSLNITTHKTVLRSPKDPAHPPSAAQLQSAGSSTTSAPGCPSASTVVSSNSSSSVSSSSSSSAPSPSVAASLPVRHSSGTIAHRRRFISKRKARRYRDRFRYMAKPLANNKRRVRHRRQSRLSGIPEDSVYDSALSESFYSLTTIGSDASNGGSGAGVSTPVLSAMPAPKLEPV